MDTTQACSIAVVAFLVFSSIGFVLMQPADADPPASCKTMTFTFSSPHIQQEGTYAAVSVDGAPAAYLDPGCPRLPVYRRTLAFPLGTTITEISVHTGTIHTRQLERHVRPAPSPVPLNLEHGEPHVQEGPVYSSSQLYPESWVTWHTGGGIRKGKHVTFLTLEALPVRYIPAVHELCFVESIQVEVTYEEPAAPLGQGDTWDMLVVAPEAFSQALEPLVQHKEDRNISTKLVTLADIYDGAYFQPQGRDDQERIKYFIKNAVETWGVEYVMLVGGTSSMPVRYVAVDDGEESRYISDLYYADLFDANGAFLDWDSNQNGEFGEYESHEIDTVDLYPDIYFGRLACRSVDEVESVVDKIIAYESMPAYQTAWFKDIIYCGGDTFPGDEAAINEGEYANSQVIAEMAAFNAKKIWASNGELRTSANIVYAFHQGAGFVDFSGHGSPTSWATHPHERENSWLPVGGFRTTNALSLSNSDALPIVILNACSNCKFSRDCIGWSFVSNPAGGAIAVCGNTGLGWGYSGTSVTEGLSGFLELQSFRSYTHGAETFGEFWADTVRAYADSRGSGMELHDYKSIEEWQPFGDPSLIIAPQTGDNRPPDKPQPPTGPSSGKRGHDYTYRAVATDPDGDPIYYMFEWGDGTNTSWLGPYSSGQPVNATHSWDERGDYEIRVKVKDAQGMESAWSDPLPISMPLLVPHGDIIRTLVKAIWALVATCLPAIGSS